MGPALILAPENSEIYPQRPTGFVGSFEKDIRGLLEGEIKIFFSQKIKFFGSPDWFYDSYGQDKSHWSELSINKTRGEDVKLTWDLSRFHWIQQLACAYNAYGDKRYLELIDSWLSSWIRDNPVNQGVNWACGQECSIRIIHILNASIICEYGIFDKERLTQLVISHLTRIFPTINYAVCQDNNHVITEAAALFICGAWLEKNSDGALADAKNIMECGRRLLEDRVQKLVMQDGGFSMYSTNYHRVLLNTLGIVELWRLKLCQPAFSREYTEKCRRAIMWLYLLVNENTGMTMNLGNNDGSNPFIVQSSDFRDFRPSIQFASVLILNQRAYESSDLIDEPLLWLKVNSKLPVEKPCKVKSMVLDQSGIVVLSGEDISLSQTHVFVRFPKYNFRPAQSDALHVDFWLKGENILRDVGSYSYNTVFDQEKNFAGITAHNTIQVDDLEPMIKVGPFLRSNWLEMTSTGTIRKNASSISWCGKYNIKSGTSHERKVTLCGNTLKIFDQVAGASRGIALRWNLSPGLWLRSGNVLSCERARIEIQSNKKLTMVLRQGLESKVYNEITEIPVVEVCVKGNNVKLWTVVSWKS